MRWAILSIFAAGIAGVASAQVEEADILAFNAALEAGDPNALRKAANRLAEEIIVNPDYPEAGIIAYEAAWALCRTGACSDAVAVAGFAATQPDAPETAPLLSALARWKADPKRENFRAASDTLKVLESAPPNHLTVYAFRELYAASTAAKNWRQAGALTDRAIVHFAGGGDAARQYRLEARLVSLISDFNMSPRSSTMREMVHLRGELDQLRLLEEGEPPSWMDAIYWNAVAWQGVMSAYLQSTNATVVSEREAEGILASYLDGLPEVAVSGPAEEPPFCRGGMLQEPEIKYPFRQAFRGRIGAVVLKFKLRDGRVVEPEVLAAVPFEGFTDEVIETVSQWRFIPSENPEETGCRLDHDNTTQEVTFAIRQ